MKRRRLCRLLPGLLLAVMLTALPAAAEMMSRAEREYNTATGLYNRGDYVAAIQQTDRYLRDFPDDARQPDAWHLKGECLYRLYLYDEALLAYQRLAELFPQHNLYDEALYGIGWSLMKLNRHAEAAPYWEKLRALTASEYADEALFRLGDCAFARADWPAAEKIYKEFLATKPNSSLADEVRYWLAITYQKTGNNDAFVRTMQRIVERNGSFSDDALYALGAHFGRQQQPAKAQEYYQRILTRHPDSEGAGRALLALAIAAFDEGRNSDGRDLLARLYGKTGDQLAPQGGFYLGQYYERTGDTAAARRLYEELLDRFPATEPWRAQAILALGDLLLAAREYEPARDVYRKNVTLPDWPVDKPLLAIARSYLLEGNAGEARLRLERLVGDYATAPSARTARYLLAGLDAEAGKWQEASERLLVTAPAPLNDDEQYLLAKCYYELGRFEFAREAFAALAQDSANVHAEASTYWLAAVQHAAGDYLGAENQYRAYRQRYPRGRFLGEAGCGLGELYLGLGKPTEARAAYRLVTDTAVPVLRERVSFGLARVLYEEKKYSQCIPALLQFLTAQPDSRYKPEALYYVASAYFQLENYDKAVEFSKMVADQYRDSRVYDDAFLLYGKALYYQKKNDAAIVALGFFIRTCPRSEFVPQANFYLAKANIMADRLDAARDICAQLLAQHVSFSGQVAYLRGQILMKQGRDPEALADFALAQQSSDRALRTVALAKSGQCLHNLHRYPEASEALLAALGNGAQGELAGRIRLLLGKCYYKMERYDEANDALLTATRLLPPGAALGDAWFWLADVRFRMNDFTGAAAAAETYLALPGDSTPLRAAALYKQGAALLNLKEYRAAIAVLGTLTVDYPGHELAAPAQMAIADASVKLNEYDRAMSEWEKVAASGSTAFAQQARLNIAQRFFESGDFGAARDAFAKLQQLYPDHPAGDEIAYYRGRLALQANQSAEAQACFTALLDSYPRSARIPEAGYYLGQAALAAQDYPRAQFGFEQALAEGGAQLAEGARLGLAQALYHQKKFAPAREQLKAIIAAGNPDMVPQALYFTALAYADENNYADATVVADRLVHGYSGQWSDLGLAVYARALFLGERDAELLRQADWLATRAAGAAGVEVLTLLAQAEARSGGAERSVNFWQRAVQLTTDPQVRAAVLLYLARQEYKNGDYAVAREHARQATGVTTVVDEDRWNIIALASYRLDDLPALAQAADEYARLYPAGRYRGELGYLTGILHDRLGDQARAMQVFEAQLVLAPPAELKARLLVALGQAAYHARQYPRARQALEQAAQLNQEGNAGRIAVLRGAVAMAEDKYREALPLLTEALSAGADDVGEVYYRLGAVQFHLRDYPAATLWLEKLDAAALARLGVAPEYEFMRGRMAADAGAWQEAVDRLTRALPDGATAAYVPDARFWRGRALAKLGRHNEAVADWEQVVDLVDDVLAIEAQLAIADDRLARRQFAEARLAYSKVLLIYANREYHDDALLGMAQCDREQGDLQSAAKQLDELVQQYPDGDRAAEARALRGQLP